MTEIVLVTSQIFVNLGTEDSDKSFCSMLYAALSH